MSRCTQILGMIIFLGGTLTVTKTCYYQLEPVEQFQNCVLKMIKNRHTCLNPKHIEHCCFQSNVLVSIGQLELSEMYTYRLMDW